MQKPLFQRPLGQRELINQPSYHARTPRHYLETMEPDILASFSSEQLEAVTSALEAALPKPAPKLVDLRFVVDLIFSRFYVVLFVGKDLRRQQRQYMPDHVAKIGNVVMAGVLLIGINLFISLFIFLTIYLVKSALGIDFFPDAHLGDQLNKF